MTENQRSSTRRNILARIRGSQPARVPEAVAVAYIAIPRAYHRGGLLTREQRLTIFEERLLEYDGAVHRVAPAMLPEAIAASISKRGAKQIAIPAGFPPVWLPDGLSPSHAEDLSSIELDRFDGVLSTCTVAIALTGTLVLQNAPGQGPRRLSLVPDFHLCVVLQDQIVETVSEAFDRLAATSTLPTTFISGPSATADIEMTRIKGVHGPRFLDVIVVL